MRWSPSVNYRRTEGAGNGGQQEVLDAADHQRLEFRGAQLVTLSGGHFDAYVKDFELASAPARDWFVTHLKNR